jgi:signal transduction histidine kinase/ActR/RegA family two-component response regulator
MRARLEEAEQTLRAIREGDSALVARLVDQQQALRTSRAEAVALMAQAVAAREQTAAAVEELRESDRRKDIFLATLAHELRNPLAPIRNALEILRLRGANDALAREAQEIMGRQLAHLVRMIDDLMEISRISRGKLELRKERVQLSAIIDHAVETVCPALLAASQRLTILLPVEPVWLQADPVRLTQVFGNLLNNAAKFTAAGGDIRVTAQLDGTEVRVSVQDTGVGISAELLPHIFDLFHQGDSAQRQAEGGLGIGLSLVRGLVALHGGRVEAYSAGLGHGSEIVVSLSAAPPAPLPSVSGNRGVTDPAKGLQILIVDDNRDAADSLALLLGLRGAMVRVAYDGPVALAILDEYHPNLAILDLGMPGMDGHELARQIRARAQYRHLRLVAMTGRGQLSDRQRSQDAGFDLHLVKPVAIEALDAMLTVLGNRACEV